MKTSNSFRKGNVLSVVFCLVAKSFGKKRKPGGTNVFSLYFVRVGFIRSFLRYANEM